MTDRLTTAARSWQMSRIRAKDTQPEWVVRRMVHGMGYRYILHDRRLPGTPDLVFPSRKRVILVQGCFWHGHKCGRGFKPKTNAAFWTAKIAGNRARDARSIHALRDLGWRVLTVWECATRKERHPELVSRLQRFLGR
jgi:DNA mismatch endonuclease (patch repair protein)